MRDPKAIRKAIMTAKSVARLIDPHFGRVPLPELGDFGRNEPVQEHSPLIHDIYHVPMPEHFAIGGPALSAYNAAKRADYDMPPEGGKAVENFIGVGPDALKTRVWGGIMRSDPLEDAYSEEPSEHGHLIRQQLHESFSPVREKLRDIFGDHVTLYRHQHDTEGHSRGHRNTLSWTIDPKVAEWFAGIRHKEKPLYSDEDIENAHQEFLKNGKVKIGRHTLVHNPESPYPEIWDDHEMVTDVDSVPEYMNWENESIKEDNDRIAKKRSRIKKAQVPLDDVIWASNRAGQREFIVHNRPDAPHYINEHGEMPNAEPEHFARGGLPTLKPAIRHKGKVYSSVVDHLSALSGIEDPEEYRNARMDGENRGYVDERGRYLDRYRAQGYAKAHGLIRQDAPEWAHSSPELISENLMRYPDQEERNQKILSGEGYAAGGDVDGRELNDFGLYSHAAEQAGTLARQDSPENYRDMLLKRGVKPAELKWSGYDEAFAGQPQISREDLVQHFRQNMPDLYESQFGTDPHEKQRKEMAQRHLQEATQLKLDKLGSLHIPYHEDPDFIAMSKRHKEEIESLPPSQFGRAAHHERWTLPGGENYREIAVQHNSFGGFPGVEQHFDKEPDIIASLRMKDRNDHEGDRVLHLDELQSDWGQNARKYGFKDTLRLKEAMRELEAANVAYAKGFESGDDSERDAAIKRHKEAQKAVISARNAVNDAAYIGKTDDWVDLGLKRALLEAAKGGYDKLAWTPGQKQADRYDMSKHIKEIHHENNADGTYNLIAYGHNGEKVYDEDDIPEEKLEGLLGKEMTQKVLSGEGKERDDAPYRDWRILSGLDLKVGGEGMKKFYDEMLPKRLQKLARMHDPEAKFTNSIVDHPSYHEFPNGDREEGSDAYSGPTTLPAIEITPKMRESILKRGFPAYAEGGEVDGHTVENPMSIFPKPQRMWDEDMPGGAYLSMPHQEDVTGHKASSASIGIQEGGKPYFHASRDAAEVTGSPGRGSATVKTNLFKQKAGWKWLDAPEGHENTNTLVSVEHRGKHHYVLHAHFPKGVDLARYPDAPSEPRLRPTTKGNVELGPQVGSISVRGKEHPVHAHAIVKAHGGEVDGFADGGFADIDEERFREYLKRIHSPLSSNPESVQKALQIASSYRAPIGHETGVGSLYSIKQSLPASAVTRTIKDIPGVKLKPIKKGSWEDFYDLAKDHEFVNVGGDLSGFGRLTHINGKPLAWPVDLHAGADYMREPNPGRVWANIGAHATGYRNKIREANERGKELYGILSPMGASAVNSSHNMIDTLLAQIPNAGIDKNHLKEFDEAIKRGDHIKDLKKSKPKIFAAYLEKLKKWPGLENAKEVSDFARPENGNINGGHRTRIVQFMDQGRWRDRGFPEVGVTRAAITNPDLMGVGGNKLGFRVVKLSNQEPSGGRLIFKHSTYPVNTFGEYVMDVPLVQRHYAQPDVIEKMIKNPTKSGQIVHPYSEDTMGRSTARKLFEEQKQIQPVNQRFIDSVMQGMENQEKYGFKSGGTARKALMIAKSSKKK